MENLPVKKGIKTVTFTSETEFQFCDLEQAAMKGNNNKVIIIKRHLFKNFVQLLT